VDERILKGTKSYVADSTKTRQDNLAASVVTLDKNFFDSSE
jgi:hypothetical protein